MPSACEAREHGRERWWAASLVRSPSSPRAPPRSGASAWPPHPPRRGSLVAPPAAGTTRAAEAPCASGRATARRIRSRGMPATTAPALPVAVLRRVGGELHDHLAEIVSREEPEKGPRRVLEALHDGLLALEAAGLEPSSHFREELRIETQVVGDDEALHEDAIADHGEEVARTGIGRIEFVLRDHAAEGNAGVRIHEPQDGIEERPAHVLEVDVDAGGTRRAERFQKIARLLVVDGGVRAQLLGQVGTLV